MRNRPLMSNRLFQKISTSLPGRGRGVLVSTLSLSLWKLQVWLILTLKNFQLLRSPSPSEFKEWFGYYVAPHNILDTTLSFGDALAQQLVRWTGFSPGLGYFVVILGKTLSVTLIVSLTTYNVGQFQLQSLTTLSPFQRWKIVCLGFIANSSLIQGGGVLLFLILF